MPATFPRCSWFSLGRGLLPLVGPLLLFGCVAGKRESSVTSHSLAGNRLFPVNDIADYFSPRDWQMVRIEDYVGYVVMDGLLDPEGKVRSVRVTRTYPDDSRNPAARGFAQSVRISSMRLDSAVDPPAIIYVVFYESVHDSSVLIYAKRTDPFETRGFNNGMVSGSPGSGKYFRFVKY